MYGNSGAKAAIEIALHDLVGRATGRPVYALLGAQAAQPHAGSGRHRLGGCRGRSARGGARYAAGYRAFKIKVGLGTPEADAERTRLVCMALKSARARTAWSRPTPIRALAPTRRCAMCARVADCGLDFFEQPVDAHDLDAMARVAAATRVPIGADEGIHSRDDIERHHERKAARGVSLKAIKLGGLRALFEAGRLCDRLGMRVNISCKTGESSVASAAARMSPPSCPAIAWGLTVTNPGLAEDVAVAPLRVENGHVEVPERPGLGIEVDERRVRRCQQDFKRVA